MSQARINVAVIGGGGREHAMVWLFSRSRIVERILAIPGNAGTAVEDPSRIQNVPLAATDIPGIVEFCRNERIDLAVIGPEVPIPMGLTDELLAGTGALVFAPRRQAAIVEASKCWCAKFLRRHGIPAPAFRVYTDEEMAKQAILTVTPPIVVKADGLASGKGTFVAESFGEARTAIERFIRRGPILLPEYVPGDESQEISYFALVHNNRAVPFGSAQDYKRLEAGGRGPMTGSMGAVSPAPAMTPELEQHIWLLVRRILEDLGEEGIFFTGMLFLGLKVNPEGMPLILELNCRPGDPEFQALAVRLEDDFGELIWDVVHGELRSPKLKNEPSVAVVLAAAGYPDNPRTGDVITLTAPPPRRALQIFHAGTAFSDDRLVTAGGRVLSVAACGPVFPDTLRDVYDQIMGYNFDGAQWRWDIGQEVPARQPA